MTSSRPWAIALAVSAAVNVFLIGGLAGMAYMRLTAPPPPAVVVAPAPPRPAAVAAAPAAPSLAPAPSLSEAPRPARHAPARPTPTEDPPPAVAAPPSPTVASARPARPPLISAGDVLSADSRAAFRRALNDANKKNRPLTQQARAERQAAISAFGSPGYDVGEVRRHLSTARSLDAQARGNVEAALTAFAAALPPQERAALADALTNVYAPPPKPPASLGPN